MARSADSVICGRATCVSAGSGNKNMLLYVGSIRTAMTFMRPPILAATTASLKVASHGDTKSFNTAMFINMLF